MDDSLRGVLIVVTIAGLFMTAILNFIVIFPQEQGATFSDPQSQSGYLIIATNNNTGEYSSLENINNKTGDAFDQWDVTQGFMGSNTLKQGQSNIQTPSNNIFKTLTIIATQLFSSNSPIVYAITVIALLSTGYITYLIIKFVRTGN